jgi:hypothetical protein
MLWQTGGQSRGCHMPLLLCKCDQLIWPKACFSIQIAYSQPITTPHPAQPMSLSKNTVKNANGEILTGRLWRKSQPFVRRLPFHSNLPRMEEMAAPLEGAFDGFDDAEGSIKLLLIVSLFLISGPAGSIYSPFIGVCQGFGQGSPVL